MLNSELLILKPHSLKKELIRCYSQGWGVNEEADSYLFNKLFGIDILIYKDTEKLRQKYHVVTHAVSSINKWDPNDNIQLEQKYKGCINILFNGDHFVALFPTY